MTLLNTPNAQILKNEASGPRGTVRLFNQSGYQPPTTRVQLVGNKITGLEAKPGMFARTAHNEIGANR
jgi:hypothetical protein